MPLVSEYNFTQNFNNYVATLLTLYLPFTLKRSDAKKDEPAAVAEESSAGRAAAKDKVHDQIPEKKVSVEPDVKIELEKPKDLPDTKTVDSTVEGDDEVFRSSRFFGFLFFVFSKM